MSPLKRSATGDDSIAVLIAAAITVMVMAPATINHTATTDPTRTMATAITDPILIMGMAMAGGTRLAARSHRNA